MVTETPTTLYSEMVRGPMMGRGGGDGFSGEDLGLLLHQRRRQQEASDEERELNIYRSGSAPPTVEGSLNAIGGLFGGVGNGGALDASSTRKGNGFLTEEELRLDPAYHAYYYSHVNLNPRLPPPLLSKEDWRFTQRLQAGSSGFGGIGDKKKPDLLVDEGSQSLFSMQPAFLAQKELEVDQMRAAGSSGWLETEGDGLISWSGAELGRHKDYGSIFQDDLLHAPPILGHPSRSASRNAINDGAGPLGSLQKQFTLNHNVSYGDCLLPGGNAHSASRVQSNGLSASHTFASVLGSSDSKITTSDNQTVARPPSSCPPTRNMKLNSTERKEHNGPCSLYAGSSGIAGTDALVAALSGINLSTTKAADKDIIAQSNLQLKIEGHQNFHFDLNSGQKHAKKNPDLGSRDSGPIHMPSVEQSKKLHHNLHTESEHLMDFRVPDLGRNGLLDHNSLPSPYSPGTASHFPHADDVSAAFGSYGLGGFSIDPMVSSMMTNHTSPSSSPLFHSAAASGISFPGMESRTEEDYISGLSLNGATNFPNLKRMGNQTTAGLEIPVDPLYMQYLRTAEFASQSAVGFTDPSMEKGYTGTSYSNLLGIQKAYLGALLQSEKQYCMPFVSKSGGLDNGYYGNAAFGVCYPANHLSSPISPASLAGPGSPFRHTDRSMKFVSGIRNLNAGVMGAWHLDTNGIMDDNFVPSLLDEFKSNKTKCYELSEIAGHVVEFSADQYGSRFIQQKLETATREEKDMVYEEITPHALTLMTDVFGNYVVQKFFEHGSAAQIRELTDQLIGHVLALSLQMYGCRVIQKAIEVVDLDQQTKMVAELDGHVMRCVRDQNGNHVIQKCIECIPENAIQFIISIFYDQVVTLSTHPYGCRVIQRVLEHCHDPKTQQIMMDEILQSVCLLAQDQYGNYVVQHVIEHGKPHERSAIITKLTGQIVQMSQQKFASNVIEKCLTFGDPTERQSLVNEMLDSTDQNEPLEAMMKDQFGNYVVQKVLETCDDEQRDIILTRIKVHLSALKKYTYGKHIVARIEKLVAAGERRIGVQSACSS